MFAHCLLPALLLLATVNYCTSYDLPPLETNKVTGSTNAITIKYELKFSIPDDQCYGVLEIDKNDKLQCPNYGFWSTYLAYVKVAVYDFDDSEISISLKEQKVMVTRTPPCVLEAVVDVTVGCNPSFF